MNINIREAGATKIIEINGNINGKNAAQIQEQITPLLRENSKLVLDLHRVELMASAGLRILISMRRQVASNDDFVLVGLNEHLQETMTMTGFIEFFTCYGSLEEVLSA